MAKSVLLGLVLAVTTAMVVVLGRVLDLQIEPVALLGTAMGAVVALVPDRTAAMRLIGFFGGFVVTLVAYLLRAAILPDASEGRAVAAGGVVAVCVAFWLVTRDRVPLWSPLAGAATVAGGYEYTFAAAPPEVATTAPVAATALLLAVAVGFLVGSLSSPAPSTQSAAHRADPPTRLPDEPVGIDQIMESSR